MPREERPPYIRMINAAFDFRTISGSRRDLRNSLSKLGFCFFKEHETDRQLFGVCKRPAPNKRFFD